MVADLLSALVPKSLLTVEAKSDEARDTLLEMIHQYASDRLAQTGDVDTVRDGHLAYFVGVARFRHHGATRNVATGADGHRPRLYRRSRLEVVRKVRVLRASVP